jgi:hypothetical protein
MLGGSISLASYNISEFTGGSVLGSLLSGAFSGAAYAAAYHENVWKGALYGGLYSVAYAATVRGAILLSSSNTSSPNERTTAKEVDALLGITPKIKEDDEAHFQKESWVKTYPVKDEGGTIADQIDAKCVSGSGCSRTFDANANRAWKFDTYNLHVRDFGGRIEYHFDRYNLNVSFASGFNHVRVDMIMNAWYTVKYKGWSHIGEAF